MCFYHQRHEAHCLFSIEGTRQRWKQKNKIWKIYLIYLILYVLLGNLLMSFVSETMWFDLNKYEILKWIFCLVSSLPNTLMCSGSSLHQTSPSHFKTDAIKCLENRFIILLDYSDWMRAFWKHSQSTEISYWEPSQQSRIIKLFSLGYYSGRIEFHSLMGRQIKLMNKCSRIQVGWKTNH